MTTLILGGNGKTGSRVADRLAERGVPYRLGSRSAEPRFDWADQSTWEAALTGAESVYVSYNPDLAVPGADDAVAALTEDGHSGELYELTGPRGPRDFAEFVRETAATGVWNP